MPLFSFEGRSPRVDPTAFVAPTATLIGDVTVEAGASVWYNAVLRGDYAPIVVREGANVQDGSVLHAPPGIPVDIGPGATVAHCASSTGPTSGRGADRQPRHGAGRRGDRRAQHGGGRRLVVAGTQIPAGVLAVGAPAKVKGPIAGTGAEMWVNVNPQAYRDLAQRHLGGVDPIDPSV